MNTASIQIDVSAPRFPVSPHLYGLFFEEINHAGDGGLYAEMVRNRAFADGLVPPRCVARGDGSFEAPGGFRFTMPADPLPGWTLCGASGHATMHADDTVFLNAANPRALRLELNAAGSARAGIQNDGFWGMAVRAGEDYRVRVHARTGGAPMALYARLVGADGATLGECVLGDAGPEWTRRDGRIRAGRTDTRARLVIETDGAGTLWFGFVSLFPINTWKGRENGWRADLVERLAALRPAFLRFPGGCFVEGFTAETIYDWKATLGDVTARRGHWNLWGYRTTNGLGFHEYLQLCEDLGAAAMFVCNCGLCCQGRQAEALPMDTVDRLIQDALDAVEYALGPVDSPWGRRRAEAGHPEPFPLKYLEIGNENSGPEYAVRYAKFQEALQTRYPELELIANCHVAGAPVSMVDEHYYGHVRMFLANGGVYDRYDRRGPAVYVGEYAVNGGCGQGNPRAAVAEAAFLAGLERNADVVRLASYAPLFVNVNDRAWNPDLIPFDNHRACVTPSYYVQKLFVENRGDEVLPIRVTCAEDAVAMSGGVGFVTWQAQAEFKDLKVAAEDGQILYANDLSKDWHGLVPMTGDWAIRDGVLRQTGDGFNSACVLPGRDWTHYDLTCRARAVGGMNGFMVAFHARDASCHARWQFGWSRTQCGMEHLDEGGTSLISALQPFPIEVGRWYDIRLEVRGEHVTGYLDGGRLQESTPLRWPTLAAVATLDRERRELIVKVINAADHDQDVRLQLAGVAAVAPEGVAHVLDAGDPLAENTLDDPGRVAPVTRRVDGLGTDMRRRFPAWSVTVLRMTLSGTS